jgi:prepilin-type N-terminal cleavage/methylation domain-containing protein
MPPRPRNSTRLAKRAAAGFGLLEVVVALAVLAVGCTLILGQVRAMLDYTRRANEHIDRVRVLANRAAVLQIAERDKSDVRIANKELIVRLPNLYDQPPLVARNFAYGGFDVPVNLGFSPVQIFEVNDGGPNRLRLLLPALPATR